MSQIEIILGLLLVVAMLATLATRLGVPYPILLVLGGSALGFVPGLPSVELDPELVFLLFLPPLLYVSALFTSWRDFRANIRPISLLAVGLVLMTTFVVAAVVHTVIGLPWAAAFVLGAIVSPTDAIAATTVAQRLGVPRRIVTILEGESLVNDATGIVAYRGRGRRGYHRCLLDLGGRPAIRRRRGRRDRCRLRGRLARGLGATPPLGRPLRTEHRLAAHALRRLPGG